VIRDLVRRLSADIGFCYYRVSPKSDIPSPISGHPASDPNHPISGPILDPISDHNKIQELFVPSDAPSRDQLQVGNTMMMITT
jgi:hypothetical protein